MEWPQSCNLIDSGYTSILCNLPSPYGGSHDCRLALNVRLADKWPNTNNNNNNNNNKSTAAAAADDDDDDDNNNDNNKNRNESEIPKFAYRIAKIVYATTIKTLLNSAVEEFMNVLANSNNNNSQLWYHSVTSSLLV